MTDQSKTAEAESLVIAIAPLLRGFSAEVQSIVLADLTATWLCGFVGSNATEVREQLLDQHVALIRKLIPHNEREVLSRWEPQGRG